MGVRGELQRSQLTKPDFAASIGVDIERLEYWLQLEEYRDLLRHSLRTVSSVDSARDEREEDD